MEREMAKDSLAAASWTLLLVLLKHMRESGLLGDVTTDELMREAREALAAVRDGKDGEATIRDATYLLTRRG